MFAYWLTFVYFNIVSNTVNKKNGQKGTFFGRSFSIEIRTLSSIISLKNADFLALMGNVGLGCV